METKEAVAALAWAINEMERRYDLFAKARVRNIVSYNEKVLPKDRLYNIVIVVDELADLMMTSPKEVEDYICRLAQMERATGIHLILSTQRPSVNVVTGLIKANIPARVAFACHPRPIQEQSSMLEAPRSSWKGRHAFSVS